MSDFTGSYDFSVQISTNTINNAIAANFYSQTLLPTVYLRGTGFFPDSDLYLNIPSVAFPADGSIVFSLPFTVHSDIYSPNVHGTVQLQTSFSIIGNSMAGNAMASNSLVVDLSQTFAIVDFDGPDGELFVYEAIVQGLLGQNSTLTIIENLPAEFGFLVQAGELQVFLSADKQLHTNPLAPPAIMAGDTKNEFLVYIDGAFVQQEFATQIEKQYGPFPIEANGWIVNSISLVLNAALGMTVNAVVPLSVGATQLPDLTISQNFELSIDPNDLQAGIIVVPEGPVLLSPGYSDLLQGFLPFVGTALLDLVQQKINLAIDNALASNSGLGAQFLSKTLFGMTATVYNVSNDEEKVAITGGITFPPLSQAEFLRQGMNPAIPVFFNNTKTFVYHFLPCYWGNQMSGDFTVSEACSQTTLAYTTQAAPWQNWDACYLCLPKLHILRPGQVTVYFKIRSAVGSGPISGACQVFGIVDQKDQGEEQGIGAFNQAITVENVTPDGSGNVIVHKTIPGLAQGNWTFQAASSYDPEWQVEIKGSINGWTPWPIYLTLGSPDTSPDQTPPYDPAVPSGIPGQ